MTGIPKAQEIYKHFKGNLYQIVSVAEHTETGEVLVVYQAMYGDFKIYARPLEMFCSKVDKEKYPKVTQEYRFELQKAWNSELCVPSKTVGKVQIGEQLHAEMKAEISIQTKESELSVETRELKAEPTEEEAKLDPMLLEFLDADSYGKRLNILAGMHHRITDEMITTMAVVCDIEISEGDLETRYTELRNCLLTLDKYEIERVR